MRLHRFIIPIVLLAGACTGEIGDTGPSNETPEPLVLMAPQVRRLTSLQYANSVRAVLGDIFDGVDFPAFNDDMPTLGFANDARILRISDVNIESLYTATAGLAVRAVAQVPSLASCVSAATDTCFASIIDDVGRRLWRRPVTPEERDDLLATVASVSSSTTRAERVELLTHLLLAAPHLIYRTEFGVLAENIARLTDYEIASALAYGLSNYPPDDELLGLAAAGALHDQATLLSQVQRLTSHDQYADALTEFYVDFLKLDALPGKTKLPSLGLTAEVRAALVAGAREDLRAIFRQSGAELADPFQSQVAHVSALTAPFFGVASTSTAPQSVALPTDQRSGILTHPAFLSVHAGEGESGIVKRGVFTLEQLLCFGLGPPPDDVTPLTELPVGFDPDNETSRRVLFVQHTSQAACVGCHQIIDPAGAGYENFDAAGRYRTTEKAANLPIDASGELRIGEEVLTYANSVEYVTALSGSQGLRSCLAERFATYVFGVPPNDVERYGFVEAVSAARPDIRQLAEMIVASPSFVQREVPRSNR